MLEQLPLQPFDLGPSAVPPAFIFLAAAGLLAVLKGDAFRDLRRWLLIAVPLLSAVNLLSLEAGNSWQLEVLELELVVLRVDRLSFLFGLLFHLGALIAGIYALYMRDRHEQVAALVYAGGALGAVFAGDLIILFLHWEMMAISSAFLVWAGRGQGSFGAGVRYLLAHLLSGQLLLAGALWHYRDTGHIAFGSIGLEAEAGWLLLLAFGIKCVFPLLHGWITDAYPRASAGGAVFLSLFSTKVAVYALARGFAGTELLVTVGTVMALFPIFYAVIENDLRRVLAYSMISQIGFMVVGIGVGTELALNGAVAHAFNETLFKALLFMAMGAVLLRVGQARASDLGGLFRGMPWTASLCLVGAASISAVPLFNGFVSKSMIMSAVIEEGHSVAWLGLLFASAGVLHYVGIKVPYFTFFGQDAGLKAREAPASMLVAMAVAALACVAIGSFPAMLSGLLPWATDYRVYSYQHVIVQLQLLLFSGAAFLWLMLTGVYPRQLESTNLDVDWVYRAFLPRLLGRAFASFSRAGRRFAARAQRVTRWVRELPLRPGSVMGLHSRTGIGAMLVTAVLAVYLLTYFSLA